MNFTMNNIKNGQKSPFQSLSPCITDENNQVYLDVLNDALANEDNKNIAITGIYGSGKSSIIRTYQHKHKEHSYLNISLASFDNCKENDKQKHDNLLEASILQQMFYHVRDEEIPDSRFKRIRHQTKQALTIKSSFFVLWLFSMFFMIKLKIWNEIAIYNISLSRIFLSMDVLWDIIVIAIFVYGLVYLTNLILRLFNNAKFNKLNLKTVEIELNNKAESSVLNKYLDEILYFFEATKIRIVVFEDLDRFENSDIFTKLRELNILVNSSKQIEGKVTFIYAIKDDMFVDEDRTKFFDFIIPVIPVITAANSENKLLVLLKKHGLEGLMAQYFISDISLYISDMRMLINIVNEFVIYQRKLGDLGLKPENMFAMVVYKNKYPEDFAELHKNEGMVFDTFQNKSNLIQGLTASIKTEITENEAEIEKVDSEFLKSISELRYLYINKLFDLIPKSNITSIEINDSDYDKKELLGDIFEKLKDIERFRYIYASDYYNNSTSREQSQISFSHVQNAIDPDNTYDEREKIIELKIDANLEEVKNKIGTLKEQLAKIKHYRLADIAKIDRQENVFQGEINSHNLLKFLIRNGYFNEDYEDYISYFYEGILSRNDKKFLMGLKDYEAFDFEYKLEKIDGLIGKIHENEFEQIEVLNFDLFDYLVKNKDKQKKKIELFLQQICNGSKDSIEFIDGYIFSEREHKGFLIKRISSNWLNMWKYLIKDSNYPKDKINEYLKLTISYASESAIAKQNADWSLEFYLEDKMDFLSVVKEIKEEKVKKLLAKLSLKFSRLEYNGTGKNILGHIYKNNHYVLNEEMIKLMFGNFDSNKDSDTEKLKTANYTTISQANCAQLKKYIDKNINDYVSNVLLEIDTNTSETEGSIIKLLNMDKLDEDNKLAIIDKQTTIITNIADIPHECWDSIFEQNKVEVNWQNIMSYYSHNKEGDDNKNIGINNNLHKAFGNVDNCKHLSLSKINDTDEFDDEEVDCISQEIVSLNELANECYSHLLRSIPYSYDKGLALEYIPNDKVKLLIQARTIRLSVENYNDIRSESDNTHIQLLIAYFDEFLESMENYICDYNDYYKLLCSEKLNLSQKIELIEKIDLNILNNNVDVLDKIAEILIENDCHNASDIDAFFDPINKFLIFGSDSNNKILLLVGLVPHMEHSAIDECLQKLEKPYSQLVLEGKKPRFKDSKMNILLLSALEEDGFISSISYPKKGFIQANTKWYK